MNLIRTVMQKSSFILIVLKSLLRKVPDYQTFLAFPPSTPVLLTRNVVIIVSLVIIDAWNRYCYVSSVTPATAVGL